MGREKMPDLKFKPEVKELFLKQIGEDLVALAEVSDLQLISIGAEIRHKLGRKPTTFKESDFEHLPLGII